MDHSPRSSEKFLPPEDLSLRDRLLNGSRLAPSGNGANRDITPTPASSSQKWWVAFLLGILFGVMSSPVFYGLTSQVSEAVGGPPLAVGGPSLLGLIIHVVLFSMVVRLLLW